MDPKRAGVGLAAPLASRIAKLDKAPPAVKAAVAATNTRAASNNRGRRPKRQADPARRPRKTVDELDAEMTDYMVRN